MTSTIRSAVPAEPDETTDPVARLADDLSRLLHTFARAKSQFTKTPNHNIEWAARILLMRLVLEGPMRASALADTVHADPSTVSRQVAELVREGLVERQADPRDGRASLLVATAEGRAAFDELVAQREEHFRRIVSRWSNADCVRFADLLRRFTNDFEEYRANFPTDAGRSSLERGES